MAERQTYRLSEVTLPQLQSKRPNVVVLPFAATEPHGGHLPYGTDIIETAAIADRACQLARGKAEKSLHFRQFLSAYKPRSKLPARDESLSEHIEPDSFRFLESLDNSGIEKAVILNGHGGNDFYTHLKEMFGKRKVFLVQVNWYSMCRELANELFTPGGDHANDMETSLVLSPATRNWST